MTKQTNRGTKFLNVLWLIPLFTLGYIGWMNLLPLGGTETYFIDVGGEDTNGDARITGPFDRISDKKEVDGISCRELEKNLVYFELEDSKLNDADEISLKIKFQDNFPSGMKFMLGSRNKEEWSYDWKEVYIADSEWEIDHKDIIQSAEGNSWLIAEVNWRIENLFIDNDKLSFCFNVPHLKDQPDKSIPIDWIKITVNVPSLRIERGRSE